MKNSMSGSYLLNRSNPLIACIAVQLCLGASFILGAIQPEVAHSLSQKNAALTFSLILGVMTLGGLIGGFIQDNIGPRLVLAGGGLCIAAGFILMSLTSSYATWNIWITCGLIIGFGTGLPYTATIAACQKWFPDKRGLITGIIVSAPGLGGLLITPLIKMLITNRGATETFIWFSIFIIFAFLAGINFIENPPNGYKPEECTPPANKTSSPQVLNYSTRQVLKTSQFYMVSIAIMTAITAGLMVIPYNKVLGMSGGMIDFASAQGIIILSLFFSLGCFFWTWISEKLTRKKALFVIMLIIGILILLITAAKSYLAIVLISITLLSFSYGGILGIYPTLMSNFWGTKNLGTNYGMVLLSFGIGAVASSYITMYLKELSGGFIIPFITASIIAFFGALLIYLLKKPKLRTNQVINHGLNS